MKKTSPKNIHSMSYRWIILAVIFCVQLLCSMSIYGLSPLGPYIRQELQMTNTQYGLLFTTANLGTMLTVTFTGSLVDKKGVRIVMLSGQVIMGIALLISSAANCFWQLACLLFLAGICQSIAGPTGAKSVLLWFEPKERATAMGIKQAGIPAAGIIAGIILAPIASALNWRIAWAFAGLALILFGLISYILYKDPGRPEKDPSHTVQEKITWREIIKQVLTKDIIILSIGCGILMGVQFAFTSYLVSYLSDVLTAAKAAEPLILAGTLYSITSAGGFAGRLGLGLISDKIFKGRRKGTIVTVNIIGTVIILFMTLVIPNVNVVLIGMILLLYGLTGVSFTGLQLSMISELADIKVSGAATGFTLALGFVGMMTVPAVFGSIIDRTGGYSGSWIFLFFLSAVGTLLLLFVKEKKK